ncbi:MAG: hypothetical protein J6C29_02350 [Clostridia bacterium]|nr:hypothetical protein [Clostridia bacterium]
MKKNKIEYIVVNAFSEISEAERKEIINNAIRTLCVMDIEKLYELDYNNSVAFHGSTQDLSGKECSINAN